MKISDTTNNIQAVRRELETSNLKKQLEKTYKDFQVLVGNFGFILVPNNREISVIKIYSTGEYYEKEKANYEYLGDTTICIPKILDSGKKTFGGIVKYYIEFQNIRGYAPAFRSIQDIDGHQVGNILGLIHEKGMKPDGKSYIHGNLHQSNFFINQEKEIGVFDFVSMHYGDLEYDIANIYFHSNYDDDFLEKILENYMFRDKIKKEKIYIHTLLKIRENIKGNIYIDNEKRDILRRDILKIKKKLGNITSSHM